ncbi:RNA-binding cell elongation regulator Jag/EloR [Pseudogracilibacillus sp. SO10305]|uniref:RNA-binding cell elongation regulator Jag/EloR n=1 Tax=Pseudogracilibacillus sp. SO10305 TaxID=3098292 RepID=UPI00300E48A5
MREVTASGQTVDEAVESALKQLNMSREEVEIDIIDEGKKGFLGIFGSSRAVVKVREVQNRVEDAKNYLISIAKNMDVDIDVIVEETEKVVTFTLEGDKLGLLIGKRGRTLNSLQYLTQLVLNKDGHKFQSVIVDAEGYRKRREETLMDLANKMAEKSIQLNKKISLEPMPAYERKIIHSALQETNTITTFSEGREPHRYIVIKPS